VVQIAVANGGLQFLPVLFDPVMQVERSANGHMVQNLWE